MQNQQVERAYSITCPACKTKQTAFIKISDGFVRVMAENNVGYTLSTGTPYILCANRWGCQHLLIGDEMEDAINPQIKNPAELRAIRQNKY